MHLSLKCLCFNSAASLLFMAESSLGFVFSTDGPLHQSCLRATGDEYTTEVNDTVVVQISNTLQKKHKELILNPSKLKPIKEQHDSDVALSAEELAQEALLSSRLSLDLNRSHIADSTLPDAGRGLFASRDIAKGELITCYPGDALLCEYEQDSGDESFDEEQDLFEEDDSEVIVWGDHIDENDKLEDDEVFDGLEDGSPPLVSYAASVNDVYSVMGMASSDDDPAYYGHFANDGGGQVALDGVDEAMGIEEMLSLYVNKSVEAANARHVPLGGSLGLHLGTVAIRDIKKNEEVFVTYGPDYWIGLNC